MSLGAVVALRTAVALPAEALAVALAPWPLPWGIGLVAAKASSCICLWLYAHVQAGFMAMCLGQLADCHDQWGTLLSITPTKH